MQSASTQILQRMTGGPPRKVWTASSFFDIANRDAVDKALQRLAAHGRIRRIDRGLYDVPRVSTLTGKPSPPDHMAVIDAVAVRDGARMLVDGITAANSLGLTNVVPAHVTVMTDARLQPVSLGKLNIVFKTASPSKLAWAGRPAAHIVQALGWLRDVMATDGDRILGRLKSILADPVHGQAIRNDLEAGLGALPSWMVPVVKDLLVATAPQQEQGDMPQRGVGG